MQNSGYITKDYSPFQPGQPVAVEFFVGRKKEVEELLAKVRSALRGRLEVAFLTGERGIGKSSLAAFVRYIAQREYKILGLHTFHGGVTSLEEFVRRVFDRLLKESLGTEWEERVRSFFGKYIRQVSLFGISVEFDAPERDLRRLAHDFVPSIRNLLKRLQGTKQGLFLILDDINGLSTSEAFANWLKSLIDEIATSPEPLPLFLLLVGLEQRRQSLIQRQASLARVFSILDIPSWSETESKEFFQRCFHKVGVTISEEALQLLVQYAGGFPVLAHEIGDAVFKIDQDNYIDRQDALKGIIQAAEVVGRKYLEPQVFQAIQSERYRTILKKITRTFSGIEFTRAQLQKQLNEEEKKVLDNFLRRMRELGVIEGDPTHGRGAYRFTNRLHYLYFYLITLRSKKK